MILPLLLSICNKAVLPLVNQLGTKPLSKHSLSCDLTLPCKLLKFFNQNPWTQSEPGEFQFGILPRILFKLSLVTSTGSCFVTSPCQSFSHFASLLWSTDSLHMSPQNFFDFSASGWSSSHLSSSWFSSLLLLLLLRQSICTERFYEFYDKICFLGVANKHSNITHLYSKCTHTHIFTKKFVRENAGHLAASNLTYALNRFKGNVNRHQTRCHWLKSSFFFFLPLKPN